MPRIRINLLLSILIPIMFVAPDFLAQIFSDKDHASLSGKFIIGLIVFAVFSSFAPRKFVFLIFMFFLLLELVQFLHLFYYNGLITASKFLLLFQDFDEVLEASKEAIKFLYLVPLLVLLPYSALFYLFNKYEKQRLKTVWATIPIIIFLGIIPYRVNQAYNGVNYYPDPSDHSLRNSLYAFTNFIINQIKPAKIANIKYDSYKIKEKINWQDEAKVNIILIIGEGINPYHMSLFGYERDTNPLLTKLKDDPNFYYIRGLSAGVNTIVSIPLFINGVYEPNNYKALEEKNSNLFKLAKQHGFKTFYISSQTGALLTHLNAEFIDYSIFDKKAPLLFNQYQDGAFLKIANDLEYAEKNFIVINQRNAHTPYESNYSKYPEFNKFNNTQANYNQFMIDSYDNAMLFNDYIIYNLIDFYRQKFNSPTYIFFTSDHSEGLGKDGIYGHSLLNQHIAEIPFIAYINNEKRNIYQSQLMQIKEPICHYELSLIIASLLGFNIDNSNYKKDVCYIQDTNLHGINDFIEYRKNYSPQH
jgi:glucan phosphoethanolaminetransferase (alkaline phosphatase superfamily)